MPRISPALALLALAACTPRVYHREAQRPIPAGMDAYTCAATLVARMGYAQRSPDPPAGFAAARERPQPAGARFSVYDYLVVEVLGDAGGARTLRVGAVTLAGGDNGVFPHFRDPVPQTEADRDAVLAACASEPASP